MAPSGSDILEYTPIGGTDNGEMGNGIGNPVVHFFTKYGRRLWWGVVGLATIIALTLLIHAYTQAAAPKPLPVTGERTKDVESLYNLRFPIPDAQTPNSKLSKGQVGVQNVLRASAPSQREVNQSTIEEALQAAETAEVRRLQQEQKMKDEGFVIKTNSPAGKHSRFLKSSPTAHQLAKDGFSMDQASKFIANKLRLTKEEARKGIRKDNNVNPNTKERCTPPISKSKCVKINASASIYRAADGLCNNVRHPGWGAANQPFRRVLLPDYADGISLPRVAADGTSLPNPRKISAVVFTDKQTDSPVASLLLPIFGQFIDHDITATALGTGPSSKTLSCCQNGTAVNEVHPECMAFSADEDNELYLQEGQKCTNLWRASRFPSCEFGPRNQFSQTTSFIDGSVIYGSDDEAVRKFREVNLVTPHGYMAMYKAAGGKPLLPVSTDLSDGCNNPEQTQQGKFCFSSGDIRVNENMALTSLHLLFTRQHNRIADSLAALNADGDDGKIFYEAREIVIAQMQHITYNEFLPVVLGQKLTDSVGISPLKEGYYEDYDAELDPTMANVFVAGAYRMGHSMLQGMIKMMDENRMNMESVPLHNLLFDPFRLWNAGSFDAILRGHATLASGQVNHFFTKELTRHLFEKNGTGPGMDLAAINIQRGRDHGLAGYTHWREVCGLDPVSNFDQLAGLWDEDALFLVRNIYKTAQDVDLYTGMLSEKTVPGAMVGPTVACLLTDQFLRLKKGDRYWYEASSRARPFTPEQLQVIRKTTLARLLCDNGDGIAEIQARVLEQPSLDNPILPCTSGIIPSLDYSLWRENLS